MKASCLLTSLIALIALSAPALAVDGEPKPILSFARLDLLDKRTLRDVVVRAYDSASDKFLVVAGDRALTIPANLLSTSLAEQLRKDAPSSGASVSSTPSSPAPAPAKPAAEAQTSPVSNTPSTDKGAAAHRAIALDRALTFYRHEFVAGSAAMRVDSVKVDAEPTRPVPGWSGRYRTIGKAYLELFDTKGWSATRAQSAFEIITEQKPDEPPVVIDFSRKS